MPLCRTLHDLHTSRLLPPAPVPPNLVYTFLPALSSLLLSLLPYATFASTSSLLPIVSLRGTFAPSGYSLHILHTSSSPPSSLAALLSFLAVPLYLDSPTGHALPLHIPSTSLAALFSRRGVPQFLLPSFCTPYLARVQIYCLRPPSSSFFLPESPSAYSGGPSGQTIYICDTCGCLFFPSSSQCMPRYRAL